MIETARNPKTAPDMAKITAMTEPKVIASKKVAKGARAVVNGAQLKTVDELFGYYTSLPQQAGPGTFEFEVFDAAGSDRDKWAIQLGATNDDEQQQGDPMLNSPTPTPPAVDATGIVPGKPTNIGNGYYLTLSPTDPTRGWLTTPSRQMIEWREGMPLTGVGIGSPTGAPSSPAPTNGSGWGAYPAVGGNSGPSADAQFYKDQLNELERRRQEDKQQQALKDMEDRFTRVIDESTKRYEALISKLTEKPPGPSPETLELKARLEAAERATAESQRRAEEDRRESQHRAEIQAMNQRIETVLREVKDSKPDTLTTLLPSFMAAMEKSSSAIQTMTAQQLQSLASRIMEPKEVVSMIQMAKDRSPDAALNKEYMEAMRGVFSMMQEAIRLEREANPGEPLWVGMLRQGFDKVGQLGQTYMNMQAHREEVRARPAAAPFRQAPQQQQREQREEAPQTRAAEAAPMTPDEEREAAAASYFRGGQPEEAEPEAEVIQPDEVINPPANMTPREAGEAGRHANERLASLTSEQIRGMIDGMDENQFFGPVVERVVELRQSVANGEIQPPDIVGVLFEAYETLQGFNLLPPAMELFKVGQFEVLLERLLPDTDPLFRRQIEEILRERFAEATEAGDAA